MRPLLKVLTAAVILGSPLMPLQGNAADTGPAEIILHSSVNPAKKAKPAFFPHAVHQDNFACETCHHTRGDDGKRILYSEGMKIGTCDSCHNKDAVATGMPAEFETFKKVAHSLCKGCHKARKKKGETAGPTTCSGCHRKGLK